MIILLQLIEPIDLFINTKSIYSFFPGSL